MSQVGHRLSSVETRCIAYFDDAGNLTLPDPSLVHLMETHGVYFYDPKCSIPPTHSVSHRHRKSTKRELDRWGIPIANRCLAVLESYINEPFPFSHEAPRRYGLIVFANHSYQLQQSHSFGWPWNAPDVSMKDVRENRVALIQANKFSAIRGEMYSLRRQVISKLRGGSIPIDVYGANWSNSWFQNLHALAAADVIRLVQSLACRQYLKASRGRYQELSTRHFGNISTVSDKFNLLGRYRFSLVIENDLGYVSEKVRDSLGCGCVTFYLGPRTALLNDLPGLIWLPQDADGIVKVIKQYLATPDLQLPDPYEVRATALSRFPHPYTLMWLRLGNIWLNVFGSNDVIPDNG